MANNTGEKILDAALYQFSENGYAGTNIQSIADAVGIVKSALYRHFESKEAIWNALISAVSAYYGAHFGSAECLPPIPKSTDELKALTLRMADFTIHDQWIIRMRRILTTEQFRDERIRKLATLYFLEDTEAIFAKIFAGMMDAGVIQKGDAQMLAFSYTSPITVLIHWCDREPERKAEAMERIERFVEQFIRTYGAA